MNTITFKYTGKTYKNCKPDPAQVAALATDTSWQNVAKSSYSTVFGDNTAMYNHLKSSLGAIEDSTSAFSAPVLASMNAQTLNTAAADNAKLNAAIGRNAAKGSATPGVESGIVQAERATASTQVLGTMANQQADITQRNAELAITERDKAITAEENLGKVFDPSTQMAGDVTKANEVTAAQANTNAQEKRSWIGVVGGLADSAVKGLTSGLTGGASLLGGLGKKSGGPDQNTPTWDPSTGNEVYPGQG